MEEIVSGPEAVSRLFDELLEAIEVTYAPTRTRLFVMLDLRDSATILRGVPAK